ncbi:MAG: hypothetical protein ACREHC_08275, partial [Candidatus Levyibacteriota bacterium]
MPASQESETGIQYGYGHPDSTVAYKLGERPVSDFLLAVYDDLSRLPQGAVVVYLGCGAGRFAANAPG